MWLLLTQAVQERDAIQAQFDRLKELRVTQSEKTLVEWKKASETRHRRMYRRLMADTLESLAAWKNRAEHAEYRLREMERDGESHRPTGAAGDMSKLTQLEKEGASPETHPVSSLTDKLAEAKQALEEEALRRAQLEMQLRAAESEKAVREDELAIRRMYEDLTGFTVTEVVMHDTSLSSRRYELIFTGTDYFGTHTALTNRPPIRPGGIALVPGARCPWRRCAHARRVHLHSPRGRVSRCWLVGLGKHARSLPRANSV